MILSKHIQFIKLYPVISSGSKQESNFFLFSFLLGRKLREEAFWCELNQNYLSRQHLLCTRNAAQSMQTQDRTGSRLSKQFCFSLSISNGQFSMFFYHSCEHSRAVEFTSLFWQTREDLVFQLYIEKAVEKNSGFNTASKGERNK